MPIVFALADKLLANPTVAIFAAFGSMSMLLFVDFGGSIRERLSAHVGLVAVGVAMVCLGTLCSQQVWLATAAMFGVGFAVLLVGIVSSVLAGATTAMLVSFILPVTLPGGVGSIPDRLAGWLLAGAAALFAIMVMWPAPTRDPLRTSTAQTCALLAGRLRAEVDCSLDWAAPGRTATLDGLVEETASAVAELRSSFFATPYRPTGLSTAARTLVRLVDEVMWLHLVLERSPLDRQPGPHDAAVCDVELAAATLLDRGAQALVAPAGQLVSLESDVRRLRDAGAAMERAVTSALPIPDATAGGPGLPAEEVTQFVGSLEPTFRAQEISFAISAITANIELTVAAWRRSWLDQLMGRRPEGVASPLFSAKERLGAHLERHSVWLHNSLRGAFGLALAVLIAELSGVQHSFWVVFGALAVLRSAAIATGQNAMRALLGTVAGIVVGGALVAVIGSSTTVLWVVLPLAVLFTGLAPAVMSFTAAQAGFTATILILFNIVAPVGWEIGLVRIEDVAIGTAVSLVVGVLFWPRGAAASLGQAIAEGFADSAQYLSAAVASCVSRGDPTAAAVSPDKEGQRAAAAARRLDDAFREFLAERGTKHLRLADISTLVSGVAVLRLTAEAILDVWARGGTASTGGLSAAATELLATSTRLADWYGQTAGALAAAGTVPSPQHSDDLVDVRLVDAVRDGLSTADGRGCVTAVRMIWSAGHLDAARRLQAEIQPAARAVAAFQQVPRSWLSGSAHALSQPQRVGVRPGTPPGRG